MNIHIGIGVIIENEHNEILLGKRKNAHGAGTWGFPGGHLNLHEAPFDCAIRETQEETGLLLSSLEQGPWASNIFENNKHYITLFVYTNRYTGKLEIREPDKCEKWGWFSLKNLPTPLFKTVESLLTLQWEKFSR